LNYMGYEFDCDSILEYCPHDCLPEGITFTTQEQIDNFQINYPGCNEIEGDVTIIGWNISNLSGLNVITAIYGDLKIGGYDNWTIITDLAGLENLNSLGGSLIISHNTALSNLSGLNNLTSIGGDITIFSNDAMTSLSGLENLDAGSIGNLSIFNNLSLISCEVQSICEYLVSPNGTVDIYFNAVGCNNPWEIANTCGAILPCLPYGNYYFTRQTDIDNFGNYSNCTELLGDVIIGNIGSIFTGITNLYGLNVIISISGTLNISNNFLYLTNLSGLDSLISINGSLNIVYNSLTSLSGLENLTTIGGNLRISGNELTNLEGLEYLTSIEGELKISDNYFLTSLAGLNNIESASITDLTIIDNDSLYNCDIWPICQYLNEPGGTVVIESNAPECNSIEEVEEHCLTEIEEIVKTNGLCIIPNPLGSSSIVTYSLENNSPVILKILDLSGRLVVSLVNEYQQQGEHRVIFNSEEIKPGVYFCTLKTNNGILTKKIIKL